jgi:type IV secretion system protein TrbD
MQKIEGFEIPLHRSLTEQILLGGVPRTIAILNGTVAAAFGIGLQSFYVLPICFVSHIAAVIMTKRDPQFFDCFRRHIKQKRYYST